MGAEADRGRAGSIGIRMGLGAWIRVGIRRGVRRAAFRGLGLGRGVQRGHLPGVRGWSG
jgi:hypothetical protein